MIKIAFLGAGYSREWMGQVNYMRNLLFAISKLKDREIEPIVFLGNDVDVQIIEKLMLHAKIIQDPVFDRKSVKWYISKILERIFGVTVLVDRILLDNQVSVISHSNAIKGYDRFVKINWISDFQHVHLPSLFSSREKKRRDRHFLNIFKKSDRVIVSSYDAYNDAKEFSSCHLDKVRVLQFTSQTVKDASFFSMKNIDKLKNKYDFRGMYFYLPNQFWKHKNHMLIFRAVKLLKDEGVDILVLCSGYMKDYRAPRYIHEISLFLNENKLHENIKLLGLIDYDDVLRLMKYSLAVINPSLFEGWSSTVEECKSMGKDMILSDIPIHREQNSRNSIYFDPNNVAEISAILKRVWKRAPPIESNKKHEQEVLDSLDKRTLAFASNYQGIILEAVS